MTGHPPNGVPGPETIRYQADNAGSESSKSVSSVHFSPDGTRLVSGSWDKTVKIWDPSTGSCLSELRVDDPVVCLSYAPNGDLKGGNLHFFNSEGEKL